MKYYLIAGEKSGDLHGGNLISSLKKLDSNPVFRGFGGDAMASHGMRLDKHIKELAFMGFWEVLKNLWRIRKYLTQAKTAILEFNPDVVILIDYGGFNLKITSFLKRNNIRCYYYITPKVWAWKQNRANKIKRLVDRMFVILPFEKEFYKKFGWIVDYVGNPVLDAVYAYQATELKLKNKNKPIVAFLPGSRFQEIIQVRDDVKELILKNPRYHFIIARVDNIDEHIYDIFDGLENVEFLTGKTYDLLNISKAAIVTSGTATLETALFKVPQVVIYKTSLMSYLIGRAVIKVNYISLVNLIANKQVVKELIQNECNPNRLNLELNSLMHDAEYRENMINGYNKIENILNVGSASENTARLIHHYLTQN